tara:strand:+ start:4998 stop:5192 length:195 start_codon:yes stop_codon:yes gene_type:complete
MNLWDEIVESYEKEMTSIKDNLAEGGASDYATYKELVGFHSGISWARNNILSIVKKRYYDDEEN